MKTIFKSDIVEALKSAGLQSGDSVMVHASLGKIGYVCGGAQAVIEALIETVGEDGTIKFSLRAKEPDCVSDIAQQFGGGGHPQAAGITMYGKLDETAGSVLDALIHKLNG